MPYTPIATDYSEPTDAEKASILGLEFRTLKGYIQLTIIPLIATKQAIGGTVTNATNAVNATNAANVPWTGVSGRPTVLSSFTNDSGFISSVAWGSVTGRPTDLASFTNGPGYLTGPIAYSSITGKPTLLSQFTNDLAGSGILSLNGRSASAATIISSDVSGALGYTPYNSANPASFTTVAAVAAAGFQTSTGSVASATTAYNVTNPASNGYGTRTVSTGAPSGGSDGDVWYQVSS